MYAPPDKDRKPSGYSTRPRGNRRIVELMDPLQEVNVLDETLQFPDVARRLRG